MRSIDTIVELKHSDLHGLQGARKDRRPRPTPRADALMERILDNLRAASPEEVSNRIASLSDIRRAKVLDVRRQLTEGTYEVANRLVQAMDRLLNDWRLSGERAESPHGPPGTTEGVPGSCAIDDRRAE